MKRIAAIGFAALLLCTSAAGVPPDEQLKNPALEAKAREISKEIRCLVCQNQSIADSDADLAKDLRKVIRERITAGDNEAQIKDYLVTRYGEFVLLKPRLNRQTALLWISPLIMVFIGIFFAGYTLRRRPAAFDNEPEAQGTPPLNAEAKRLLDGLRQD